jgi:hypothetical protein
MSTPASTIRFVKSLYQKQVLGGVILTMAAVNVSLGSWAGEGSQVFLGLTIVAIVLGFRHRGLKKPASGIYENDPNSGKNET